MCSSQKKPERKVNKNPRGGGLKSHNFRSKVWNVLKGGGGGGGGGEGGLQSKKPSMGEYGYFLELHNNIKGEVS